MWLVNSTVAVEEVASLFTKSFLFMVFCFLQNTHTARVRERFFFVLIADL